MLIKKEIRKMKFREKLALFGLILIAPLTVTVQSPAIAGLVLVADVILGLVFLY